MPVDWLTGSWKSLILRGVLAIIFGIIAIWAPIDTAITLALVWGIWAAVDGVSSIYQAFTPEGKREGRAWLIVMGIIALIAAFIAIVDPGFAATALTWTLGIWLVVRGVFELAGGFAATDRAPRWIILLSGILSIVLGVLFILNPAAGAVSIAFTLGVFAIAWGVTFIAAGFTLRRLESSVDSRAHRGPTPQPT
jgi:uncharacterized membrane protein HdeD (DUF308 family)